MSFNFIDTGGTVSTSQACLYDSNIGYETDFSIDGDVNGWTIYNGIHTYGCWNNFLFGTLYGDTSIIGRHNVFRLVEAEHFYTVKIVMKLNIKERIGTQNTPGYGRIAWTTEADPIWSSSKEFDFIINTDNKWHTYNLNMGEVQWWQGDINNLRLCPILQDGRDGDEFFVRVIKVLSIDTYKCNNTSCDYFSEYQHPCVGIGERGTCSSKALDLFVQGGTIFDFAIDKKYTIIEGINDELLVNINEYGYESIKLPVTNNVSGAEMAKIMSKEISKINVGGYSEVFVEYNSKGQFVIHSGTYVSDSIVKIGNSPAAVTLNFYDEFGNYQSEESVGQLPASGYRPLSSFKINTNQVLNLFSNVENTGFFFNPFIYNIEGGRRDWLDFGLGVPSKDVRGQEDDETGVMNRYYDVINNAGSTIIDFNHPFNASGRITKLYLAVTLDNYGDSYDSRGDYDESRIDTQLENAEVMFFRPLKDGTLKTLGISVLIKNRDHVAGNLYSITQEYVEIDCDVFVNKGDLIGVYNANIYKGRSVSGIETDALFYQVDGKASGILNIHTPLGEGSSGLLLYARSDQIQNRVVIDIDLSDRINIDSVDVIGDTVDNRLEYNIARCLDINWNVDLFGEDHSTGWVIARRPYVEGVYNHPNIYYGKGCLTDGIKTAPDGLAGTSFSVDLQTYYRSDMYPWTPPPHIQNGGAGVIVHGAKYFQVNGDSEWLAPYLLAGRAAPFAKGDYKRDPIAFTLLFPYGKKKKLSRLKVYFKERYNFRSFALSFFKGDSYSAGTADIPTFDLIPNRLDGTETPWLKLVLDGLDYVPEDEIEWGAVDLYLANNPIIGHEILQANSITMGNYDPVMEYYGGGMDYDESGVITNNEQVTQARSVDWTTLLIEWPESEEFGFRLYCDYHESTKICEMELFCTVDDVGSSMAGSVSVIYSSYGETLWLSDTSQDIDGNVNAFIGDTPRYITVEITPITEIELRNINVNVGEGDFFLGEKGCQSEILPVVSKTDNVNEAVPVTFKNVYEGTYDLYVDIVKDTRVEDGLIFYSRLNDQASITSPEVGADSYYKKEPNYSIKNDNYNVAINCPVYGLKNLVDGAEAWYSHDNNYSWHNFGILSSDENVNFSNITSGDFSTINLPVISRNRYWKIGWLAEDHSPMNIREMRLFYNNEEVDCDFYHDIGLDFEDGPISDTALHLNNGSITGSYYALEGGSHIGIDLGSQKIIDKIILFNDSITDYSPNTAGIDKYTELNLTVKNTCIIDYSYDEREFSIVGNGVGIGPGKWDFNYSEVTTVSGLFSSSDTTPTNISLGTKPELVDGELWDIGNGIDLKANYSMGVDFGEPKEITRIRFYLNILYNYNLIGWDYRGAGGDTWYIYKSDDNVNWTLCYTIKGTNLQIQIQNNPWEFTIEFFFNINLVAKYFKMWCSNPMYVNTTQGWWGTPTCSEIKVFSEIPNSHKTGISFSGAIGSYISVPASSDFTFPGTNHLSYGALCKPFTIDFHVKFNSPPVASGMEYCSLIRNWADPVTTVKYGNIQYPPENWMSDAVIENAGVGTPDANYAIFVKKVYDLSRVQDAVYSCSTVGWGTCENAFSDDFNVVTQWTTAPPCYAQCTLPEPKKVIKYGLYGYYSSGYGKQPIDWSLQAYVTASGTWIDLHTVTDHPLFIQYQMEYWEFDNPYPACTEYRLYVTKNEWHPYYTRLPVIQLFDASENVEPSLYQMEFWIQSKAADNRFFWDCVRWKEIESGVYHVSLTRDTNRSIRAFVNGIQAGWQYSHLSMQIKGLNSNSEDLMIGENFNSVISDLRITKDLERTDQYLHLWHRNERYYAMSVYVSEDNLIYGKFCDLDLYKETAQDHYYYPENVFSSDYYSYFAIDLGHSYDIDIIRSFPVDEAHQFDLSNNITYSNVDTSDPSMAFITLSMEDISTDFSGGNKTLPNNWSASGGPENYIFNNMLHQSINSGYVNLTTDFYLVGDFDFEIEYMLINNVNVGSWFCGIQLQDIDNEDNSVKIDRAFYDGHNRYRFNIKDDNSSWTTAFSDVLNHRWASVRFTRVNQQFTIYIKDLDVIGTVYSMFGAYEMTGGFGGECTISIITESSTPDNPLITIEWDNLVFTKASPLYSSHNDARWLRIKILNGDDVTRTIKRIGVYPDISVQVSNDGNYNTDWIALGESVTSYVVEENVATNADVEASSYVGVMEPENAVNGLLTTELQQAWGSEKGVPQWITVTLPQEMQIYRIKLHLGYDDFDTDHLIQDYTVQTSDDNETFNTIFTITGNTSFSRTHDLITPVTTSYIRIYITAYKYKRMYVETLDGYTYWEGASLRQIEIYEYYGNTIISSEEYPIISLDLKQNYFIRGHNMIGVDAENTDIDWDNNDSNYTYSNSNLDGPKKVSFGEWGETPGYEKWVAIKRNTATHYPLVPDEDHPYRDTEDYLKHVIIQGAINEDATKPNPVEQSWMWRSNISELGCSYDYVKDFSSRSLSIKYPASSQSDHVYFIEGDDFGSDDFFSWRDSLGFYLYIDSIDALDLSHGYIYFGGHDSTEIHNPVIYKWNMTTLSGGLKSGWNNLILGMKYADEVEWTDLADKTEADPRILHNITLQKIGMVFKGKGTPITMYINGFIIERSHFNEGGQFNTGLYLHGNDILKTNIGELDFHSGTLEFFIRPDWDLSGKDIYKEFKFRSLFHFGNVANDVLGASIIPLGIEIYYGNLMENLTLFRITDLGFGVIDRIMHMAFVFSNDGIGIGNDGSAIRVYVNNVLIAKSLTKWKVSDEKYFHFIFGGQSLLVQKMQGFIPKSSSVDGVVSNVKIYNYCKTDFRGSIRSADIEGGTLLTKPSDLIEISKDNVTFYRVGDAEIPFYFKNVLPNETVPVYVRTTIPNLLTGNEKRTAELFGQWDIGV